MENFHKVAGSIDVKPLLMAIVRQPELWNQITFRTAYAGTAHAGVDDIILRFNEIDVNQPVASAVEAVFNGKECVDYPAMALLPHARPLIFDLMRMNEGHHLGRVMITRLPPGGRIAPHVDEGAYAKFYDRFHILLKCPEKGFAFRCGDEHAPIKTGECWWFNNQVEHELINNGEDDRISMIIDIGCR